MANGSDGQNHALYTKIVNIGLAWLFGLASWLLHFGVTRYYARKDKIAEEKRMEGLVRRAIHPTANNEHAECKHTHKKTPHSEGK